MTMLSDKTKLDLKFSNVWAILFTIVSLTISMMGIYNGLCRRIDLLTQKVDYIAKTQDEYLQRNKEVQIRVGTLESMVKTIDEKQLIVYRFLKL